MKQINFIVIGGSGHWCELNHYPAILSLSKHAIESKVAVICDPINPRETKSTHYKVGRKNLKKIIEKDQPYWLNPKKLSKDELRAKLDELVDRYSINAVIIASNPTDHYFYAEWAVSKGINTLCDKPLITIPDSSWKISNAKKINQQFTTILEAVVAARQKKNDFIFCTPLRRRALTSFNDIATGLENIYDQTGQGVTHMNLIVNGGVHRYPVEYLKGGAHGYLDGVGSLSHSSYHYIDVIAWYLQSAPGKLSAIEVSLPYVSRVRDYLNKRGYEQLMRLNDEQAATVDGPIDLPESVLNCELDFMVVMKLKDQNGNSLGSVEYSCNHTTYTSRTTKYEPDMLDHTNDKGGGRMSQIYLDVHQGPVQNFYLTKNDIVFEGDEISVIRRLHPNLGSKKSQKVYADAYNTETVTTQDLFVSFARLTVGLSIPKGHLKHLQVIETQKLSHALFASIYELIALNFSEPNKLHSREIKI